MFEVSLFKPGSLFLGDNIVTIDSHFQHNGKRSLN